jgi:hypothetical protein
MDVTFTPVKPVLGEREGEAVWEINENFGGLIASDNHNNIGSETGVATNGEIRDLNVTNESSDSHSEQPLVSFPPQEKPDDNSSLGLLGLLPRELRDTIWDQCYQEKEYDICLRRKKSPGTVNFSINALLPQLRLVSKQVNIEYNLRCPAKAVLIRGGLMRTHYNFKTEQRNTRQGTTNPLGEFYLRAHNLSTPKKLLLFEIAGIQTHDFTTDDYTENTHWLKNNNVAEPPEGSFTASLRFYDDLDDKANRAEFMRVFNNFQINFQQESEDMSILRQPGATRWEYRSVAEVTVHSGERALNNLCKHLPTIGKWTPEDGFEFNGTPHGLIDPRTGDLKVVKK